MLRLAQETRGPGGAAQSAVRELSSSLKPDKHMPGGYGFLSHVLRPSRMMLHPFPWDPSVSMKLPPSDTSDTANQTPLQRISSLTRVPPAGRKRDCSNLR